MKKYLIFALVVLLIGSLATGVLARGKTGPAGESNVGHLYLVEKNPVTWEIVDGGAWGKMKYNKSGPTFDFAFNGHGLVPNTEYTLIYYVDVGAYPNFDPWLYNGGALATGTSNRGGNIRIVDSVDLNSDLPWENDQNPGAKIWLVLTEDYDAETFIAWNPAEYLFEYDLISYEDTDN